MNIKDFLTELTVLSNKYGIKNLFRFKMEAALM
jgi:hypothetical protein